MKNSKDLLLEYLASVRDPRSTTTTAGGVSTSPTPMTITWRSSPGPTGAVPAEPAA